MKVLMLSTDSSVLVSGSPAQERMQAYGTIAEKLYVIVLHRVSKEQSSAAPAAELPSRIRVGRRLVLCPTYSSSKMGMFFDCLRVAKKVLPPKNSGVRTQWLITAQNPFEVGILGAFLAWRHDVQLELQLHTDMESPYFKHQSVANLMRTYTARFLISRAAGVRVVSARIARSIAARARRKPSVLPVCVPVSVLRTSPLRLEIRKKYPQFDFFILIVSRLTREKDVGTALTALALVLKKYPKTGLLIVGDGPERKNLELQARSYKLEANVLFEGWQEDLSSYYRGAHVYLLTSLYEGYARTLVEAASLGCPVVTSDVGVSGELFTHDNNALVCPVGDAECFSRELLRIREDGHLARALSVRAEQTINDHVVAQEEYLMQCAKMWRECLK